MIEVQIDMKNINEDNSSPKTENYLIVILKYTISVKTLETVCIVKRVLQNKLELN